MSLRARTKHMWQTRAEQKRIGEQRTENGKWKRKGKGKGKSDCAPEPCFYGLIFY
jgi:hypothetical protein